MDQSAEERQVVQPDARLLALLPRLKEPLLLGHVNPDADCLGSALGLALAMRAAGIPARLGLPGEGPPKKLRFMIELASEVPIVAAVPKLPAEVVVLDSASEKRINFDPKPDRAGGGTIINIDHHISNTDFGTHNWIDPHASSTSEMIALLLARLGWQPGAAAASLLYAGIHGDTGGFSLPNTSAEALSAAGELVRAGADVAHIGEQMLRSQARHDFQLLRRVFDHTTISADGRIAYSFLTHEDVVDSRCTADDIDDQVSIPRALKGVQIAMLFSEAVPGIVRVNLRGEGRTPVLGIAQAFGGGGHAQAAGVRVRGRPMQAVIEEVMDVALKQLGAAAANPERRERDVLAVTERARPVTARGD